MWTESKALRLFFEKSRLTKISSAEQKANSSKNQPAFRR